MDTKHKPQNPMQVKWKVSRSKSVPASSPWWNETCQRFLFVCFNDKKKKTNKKNQTQNQYVQQSLVQGVPEIQEAEARISTWNRLYENYNSPVSTRWVPMDAGCSRQAASQPNLSW